MNSNTTNPKSKIKKSYIHKNCLSTGNLFFDKIVGGFSLGTTVLLMQDSYSKMHTTFLRYFLAEGMVKNNKNIILHTNDLQTNSLVEKIPYKSTQVESLLNAKKISDVKNDEMKIAWRYESIQYSNIIEDIVQSAEYIFDISRPIQEEYRKNLEFVNVNKRFSKNNDNEEINNKNKLCLDSFTDKFDKVIKGITSLVQDHMSVMDNLQAEMENKEEEEVNNNSNTAITTTNEAKKENEKEKFNERCRVRIVVPDFFSFEDIQNMSSGNNIKETIMKLKARFMALKNIARATNGVIFLTANTMDLPENVKELMYYYFDYVFKINGFTLTNDKIEDYEGIFKIEKIPRISALKMPMHSIESDTYGLIMEKRKLIIEQVDIGVEIDRNTKVKEKDINPTKVLS